MCVYIYTYPRLLPNREMPSLRPAGSPSRRGPRRRVRAFPSLWSPTCTLVPRIFCGFLVPFEGSLKGSLKGDIGPSNIGTMSGHVGSTVGLDAVPRGFLLKGSVKGASMGYEGCIRARSGDVGSILGVDVVEKISYGLPVWVLRFFIRI